MADLHAVLIVGAGPTGLVVAHELARAGVACRLVDKAPHRAMESRAIAIHPRTLETFELMGLADAFLAAGQRIVAARIRGGNGLIAQISPGSLDTRYRFILGVPQDETERILEERIGRLGVPVERNTELIGLTAHASTATARLRQGDQVEEVEAQWVLGCDGAHSAVRDQLAIPFSGSTYPEHFLLADVKVQGQLDHNEASVWLNGDSPLAFFPLPADRWRVVVANSPADWQREPSLAQCQELVDERGPGGIQLADPRWTAVFRIHRRIAQHFRQNRVFLLGDAAHIHSPVGGQGMNMGIQDAFNLAWKLGAVIGSGGSPALLDSYEPERRPIDEAVVRQTDRATRLTSLQGAAARFIRDHLISLAIRLSAVEEKIAEAFSGIAANYRHSPIIEDHAAGAPGPHAGDRAPDAQVDDPNGVTRRLYELFAQQRHVLLLVGGGAASQPGLSELRRRSIAVRRITPPEVASADLIDRSGEVAARYGLAGMAYLIRPDGYVGFRCGLSEAPARLPRYLARILGA